MKTTHTTIRNQNLFCENCGEEHKIAYPISIAEMNKKVHNFNLLHRDCKPTWKEPEVDQTKSVRDRAMYWMAYGETGLSSRTIWHCMMGNIIIEPHHPVDPDDFKRCYKLLQAVPEWKTRIREMRHLSREWAALADNWDKLTEMYEQNVREHWRTVKKIGMYEFMQSLTKRTHEV